MCRLGGIIATLDPARIEFRQTMDELNMFCRVQNMPPDLTVKLRSYFRNTIYLVRSRRYEGLLQKMSTRLRGDAAYRMCENRLRAVPFLVHPDLEPEFMCNLAIKYKTTVYSRLERVVCTHARDALPYPSARTPRAPHPPSPLSSPSFAFPRHLFLYHAVRVHLVAYHACTHVLIHMHTRGESQP